MSEQISSDLEEMVVINDNGFVADDLFAALEDGRYVEFTSDRLSEIGTGENASSVGLVVSVDEDLGTITPHLSKLDVIKVPFGSFADGRGFSVGIALRRAGFEGRLRAVGQIISDQYAHARRCGFDEVAISKEQSERQPQEQWMEQVAQIDATYQIRLQQATNAA